MQTGSVDIGEVIFKFLENFRHYYPGYEILKEG